MDSQLPDDPNDAAGFIKAMTDGFIGIGKRRNVGRIAPIVFFDKKWKKSYDKLHAYIDIYVKRALEVTSAESEDKTADVDDKKSLQLFKNVIWEAMRLTGPSGRIQHYALRDTILPVGGGEDGKSPIFVEKGTVVSIDLYSLHHDKDIWGVDGGELDPHRWVGKRPMWEFVPFLGLEDVSCAAASFNTECVSFGEDDEGVGGD